MRQGFHAKRRKAALLPLNAQLLEGTTQNACHCSHSHSSIQNSKIFPKMGGDASYKTDCNCFNFFLNKLHLQQSVEKFKPRKPLKNCGCCDERKRKKVHGSNGDIAETTGHLLFLREPQNNTVGKSPSEVKINKTIPWKKAIIID